MSVKEWLKRDSSLPIVKGWLGTRYNSTRHTSSNGGVPPGNWFCRALQKKLDKAVRQSTGEAKWPGTGHKSFWSVVLCFREKEYRHRATWPTGHSGADCRCTPVSDCQSLSSTDSSTWIEWPLSGQVSCACVWPWLTVRDYYMIYLAEVKGRSLVYSTIHWTISLTSLVSRIVKD